MRKKKNLNFSFVTEDSMLIFQKKIVELKEEVGSWVQAVTSYCEDNSIDVEDIIPLLSEALKTSIYEEGLQNRTVKNNSLRLPI